MHIPWTLCYFFAFSAVLKTSSAGLANSGLTLASLYEAVKNYLDQRNAYDPTVPDKCVLDVETTSGGNCVGYLQCGQSDAKGDPIGQFPECKYQGTNNFSDPRIGDFSVTFTKAGGQNGDTQDGLHGMVFRFANIQNWVDIDVEKVWNDHQNDKSPDKGGAFCQNVLNLQQVMGVCGIPMLNTAMFGISNFNQPSPDPAYAAGWCTAHIVQYQKDQYATKDKYTFDVALYDAKKASIGLVQKAVVDDKGFLNVPSKLPAVFVVQAGATDSVDPTYSYNGASWICGPNHTGGDSQCDNGSKTAKTKDGFENGDRESDMGFTC